MLIDHALDLVQAQNDTIALLAGTLEQLCAPSGGTAWNLDAVPFVPASFPCALRHPLQYFSEGKVMTYGGVLYPGQSHEQPLMDAQISMKRYVFQRNLWSEANCRILEMAQKISCTEVEPGDQFGIKSLSEAFAIIDERNDIFDDAGDFTHYMNKFLVLEAAWQLLLDRGCSDDCVMDTLGGQVKWMISRRKYLAQAFAPSRKCGTDNSSSSMGTQKALDECRQQ